MQDAARTHDSTMCFPQTSDYISDGSRCAGSSSYFFSVLSTSDILDDNKYLMTWAKGPCEHWLLSEPSPVSPYHSWPQVASIAVGRARRAAENAKTFQRGHLHRHSTRQNHRRDRFETTKSVLSSPGSWSSTALPGQDESGLYQQTLSLRFTQIYTSYTYNMTQKK